MAIDMMKIHKIMTSLLRYAYHEAGEKVLRINGTINLELLNHWYKRHKFIGAFMRAWDHESHKQVDNIARFCESRHELKEIRKTVERKIWHLVRHLKENLTNDAFEREIVDFSPELAEAMCA